VHAGGAQSALGCLLHPKQFADRSAGPRAHVPLLHGPVSSGLAGAVTHGTVRTDSAIPQAKVKEHCCRHDRHANTSGVVPQGAFGEPAHDAVGGGEAKGAPAGQQQGVRLLDEGSWAEECCFARPWGQAPYRHPGDHPRSAEDHRTAGERQGVRGVPHTDAWYVGDRSRCERLSHRSCPPGGRLHGS